MHGVKKYVVLEDYSFIGLPGYFPAPYVCKNVNNDNLPEPFFKGDNWPSGIDFNMDILPKWY